MKKYYVVLINEGNGWEDCGEGIMTLKTAERIAREIRQDFGCRAKVVLDGDEGNFLGVAQTVNDAKDFIDAEQSGEHN